MKSNTILCLLSITLLGAMGCSSVNIPHALSDGARSVDRERFEGSWVFNDDTVVSVTFDANGVAQIAGLDWDENQFQISRGEAIVTEGEAHNFLSLRFLDDDGTWDGYYFCAYKFTDGNDLILWPPVPSEFERMINDKVLKGSVEKSKYSTQISITNAVAEIFDVINDPGNLKHFDYRDPAVLRKIRKK